MSQRLLDNIPRVRTLPCVLKGTYYEQREVSLSESFTPDRAYARRVHHLPLYQHGDEPPDPSLIRRTECSQQIARKGNNRLRGWVTERDGRNAEPEIRVFVVLSACWHHFNVFRLCTAFRTPFHGCVKAARNWISELRSFCFYQSKPGVRALNFSRSSVACATAAELIDS